MLSKENDSNLLEDLIDNKEEVVSVEGYYSQEHIKNCLNEGEKMMVEEKPHLINPSVDNLSKLSKIRRSNAFVRMFHSMNEGSLRGVALLFVRLTFGVGILTLPFYMKQFGCLFGVLVLFLTGYVNYLMYSFLAEVGNEDGAQDFLVLVKRFTPRSIHLVFKYTFLLDLMSMIIFFTILLYNIFGYLMAFTGLVPDEWFENKAQYKYKEFSKPMFLVRGIYLLVSFLFLLPFMFKKSLGALKTISNYYLTVLMCFVLFIVIEMAFFRVNLEKRKDFKVDYVISKPKVEWIEYFFAVLLSYYSQTYFFAIRNELMHPTTKRLKKLSLYSVLMMFLFFTVLCTVCYICLGNVNMPDLIVLRTPYPGKPFWSEICFRIFITIFFIMSLISFPLYNPSVRDFIYSEFEFEKTRRNWILISALPFVLGAFICFVYPSIIGAWNFFGITVYNFNG